MNGAQRAVVCVGLGLVLAVVGFSLRALWWPEGSGGAWFNYAPNEGVLITSDDSTILGEAAMWMVLVVIWTGVSLVIMRGRMPSNDDRGGTADGRP